MDDCRHTYFQASVNVKRILKNKADQVATHYVAEIRICCVECGKPFEFKGCGCGLRFDGPMVDVSAQELRAPIEPAGERLDLDEPPTLISSFDAKVH